MMGETLLASAGDTIKLWNAQDYTLCQDIPFENGRVNSLTWNQDGQCLASLGESGEEIFLSAICSKSEAKIGVVRGIETPTYIKFASRSPHYLGVGSASGTVTIWNVKSQSKKKVFAPTDRAITRVAFSYSDSHIAAATKKGLLYMLSVVNNLTAGPYTLFNNQEVTDLTYSRVKKSLLGCCSVGGEVSLHDAHTNKTVHSFPEAHSSPVAAISFSPVNELLMVSVGYDKKLACYNVQNKQPVLSHCSCAPLTSICFLGQGQLVALGTMTGQVLVHDMRSIRTPITTFKAHRTPVTKVLLQPSVKPKPVSSDSMKESLRKDTEATLTTPHCKPSKLCSDQPTEIGSDLKPKFGPQQDDNLDLSVFSPIRETNLPSQIPQVSGYNNPTAFIIDNPAEDLGSPDVLSPLRATESQQKGSSPLSHWLLNINEDNLLSPVRETTPVKSGSDCVIPDFTAPLPKPCPHVESPSQNSPNKENIEPCGAVTKKYSLAVQRDSNPIHVPSIMTPSEGTSSILHLSSLQHVVENTPPVACEKMPQEPHQTPVVGGPKHETDFSPDLPKSSSSDAMPEPDSRAIDHSGGESKLTKTTVCTSAAPQLLTPSTHFFHTQLAPPKKKQLLGPVQASDLSQVAPPPSESASDAAVAAMLGIADTVASSHVAPHLQVDLVRSCMVDVLEEFQDDLNRRLMHLQYVMTKQFLQQKEEMERLHRQHSLNEELLKENEQLRQEIAHLRAKY